MSIFKDKEYTKESLEAMTDEELLALRNEIAVELGVSTIKGFRDHEMAVDQTLRALSKFEERMSEKEEIRDQVKVRKQKPPKEPRDPRPIAKSAMAKNVKRPTRKMFSTIKKIGEHDGTQPRGMRWPNYRDGMTIVDVIENEGTEPWDVYAWVACGIMSLTEPTDEEYAERKAAWYEKHGRVDPDVAKEL
jgi:hypothetical protein